MLDLYSPQTQPSGGDSPPQPNAAAKLPKNDKKPSVTPPTSASPVPASKPASTPVKNGSEEPKIDMRFNYPAYSNIPYPVYTAPPPIPTRLPIPSIPLGYSEPPPVHRFPSVNVPPPNYFPPLSGRPPPPHGVVPPSPVPPSGPLPLPPRAYYPPP